MNEPKLREAVDRAAKAEALLRDPIIVEAFEALDREFVLAWKESAITDTEAREHIYRLCKHLTHSRDTSDKSLRTENSQKIVSNLKFLWSK